MQFNTYNFLLLFLPLTVVVYFLCNRVHKNAGKIILLAASLIFYGVGNLHYSLLLYASILFNYLISRAIIKYDNKKIFLASGIIVNVLILSYYKYLNFFLSSINEIFKSDIKLLEILLPLGISFYTFQQISYLVSVYRKELNDRSFLSYALYILYFPKILMGPITEPEELIPQFDDEERKKADFDNIADGIRIFIIGLFKKVIFADTFVKAGSWGFANFSSTSTADLIIAVVVYLMHIYFDFSGYSDMGIGISRMLNIDLPVNFDAPFRSLSVREFWKRWHITLGRFLTNYIYVPLGGSRKGIIRTYLNTLIVFLISGLWHGANWTFIVWGLYVGVCNILDRVLEKEINRIPKIIRWFCTFLTINVYCILFMSNSLAQSWEIITHLFQKPDLRISYEIIKAFDLPEIIFLMNSLPFQNVYKIRRLWVLVFTAAGFLFSLIPADTLYRKRKNTVMGMIICILIFVWCIISLGTEPTFVYNNF